LSGLCGWLGGGGAVAPEDALDAMESALPHYGAIARQGSARAAYGLASAAHPDMSHWHDDERFCAAIEGYPIWSKAEWRDLADREGHGRALAAAYEAVGEALLKDLQGPFSLAVVDKSGGRALLAIDRFGTEPMSYTCLDDGTLVFGSTTDSLRAHPETSLSVSPQAIFDFFFFVDRIPAPQTIYKEAKKLIPGQCLVFDRGRAEVKSYWRMPYTEASADPGDVNALRHELVERMRAATSRCLAGENSDRVGAFLSGGLDSSTVLGLLAQETQRPPHAVTIGFDTAGFDETAFAEIAARHFGAQHHVYYIRPEDTLGAISKIAAIYDEPFANSSAVPAYLCALKAKEAGVDLMLAGDGGDELFAGNERYLKDGVFDHYSRLPRFFRRWILEPAVACVPGRDSITLFRKARNYIQQANMPAAARLYANALIASMGTDRIFEASLLEAIDPNAPQHFAAEIFESSGAQSKLHKMLWLDLRLTLADSDLRKVRRTCELAGVRVKYPFLDQELAEFSARVPPNLLMAGGQIRRFYKDAFQGFLPNEILTKEKHGFGLPYMAIMKEPGPLQDLVCDALSGLASRGYLRRSFLESQIQNLRGDGPPDGVAVAWDLMTLEMWFQSRSIH